MSLTKKLLGSFGAMLGLVLVLGAGVRIPGHVNNLSGAM